MEMTLRAAKPQERFYCYEQSSQLVSQTGFIGDLRVDMGDSGIDFHTSWYEARADRRTDEFKEEFEEVINALRSDAKLGGILKSLTEMYDYCFAHPEANLGGGIGFAFRVDTKQHSYLLRLNPRKGEYNLYCFCYQRKWLDRHIEQAQRGIRFITPFYSELFRIPDGDMIRIIREDGTYTDRRCRYIDDYHVETGGAWGNLYHICEFAEMIERNGNTVIPLRSSLPDKCYCVLPGSDEIIIVKRGETGYYRTDKYGHDREDALNIVAELNESGGVTRAQTEAMLAGSMFGWGCPAADPKSYDEDGKPIPPKHRDRGDTR